MGLLYTIGHSQHDFEYFSELLLGKNITYSYMGKYFGARPENMELYNEEGYLDFEKVAQSDFFIKGMKNVILGLNRGNNIALMCTEKDPIDCHRAILVARTFALNQVKVTHILPDGRLQTQEELDERLLDMYFPDRAQLTIFNFNNILDDEENLKLAYKERNREIGYHLQNKQHAVV